MATSIEARLRELGIELPKPVPPVATYVPCVLEGSLLTVAGQLPLGPDGLACKGKLGAGVGLEDGAAAARLCAVNILAQAKLALGSLDRVKRVVKLNAYVASAPDFTQQAAVVNGASNLLVEIFGEAGKHARTSVGVAVLPLDAAVEIDAVLAVA